MTKQVIKAKGNITVPVETLFKPAPQPKEK